MAKNKTAYVCSECGADFSRWQGQCSDCKEWNTITEETDGEAASGAHAWILVGDGEKVDSWEVHS